MGNHINISRDKFPKQSQSVGKRADVCFNYDTSQKIGGTILRDDLEAPGETVIQLDDGRVVRSTECQYSPIEENRLGKRVQ